MILGVCEEGRVSVDVQRNHSVGRDVGPGACELGCELGNLCGRRKKTGKCEHKSRWEALGRVKMGHALT